MDRLTIINRALMKTGLPLAASLNDCDWNASVIFEDVTEELLRGHPWGFAQKFAVLNSPEGTPAHGFNYCYKLPDDAARAIDVRGEHDLRSPRGRFVLSGRRVYCNLKPCNLRYVARILDPDEWPPDFANAVSARIAQEIAALSAESMGLVPQLAQLAQIALGQAQLTDARETTERVSLPESVYQNRRSGQG